MNLCESSIDSHEMLNAGLLHITQVPQEGHDVMLMFTVQLGIGNHCQFVQIVLFMNQFLKTLKGEQLS